LPHPFIVAAGLVKGRGFKGEAHALNAVQRELNIIQGWRSVPALVGTVEFGSFTRYPRMGNDGTVVWRDPHTRSTQNRIGLKNPGAHAAAEFLARNKHALPPIFGVNIAPTPALPSPTAEADDIRESLSAFLSRHILPSWFTLNLSCPNTEDDPHGNQTEEKTRLLCRTFLDTLRAYGQSIPLWVKISPALAPEQVAVLVRVFAEEGVSAVVATNTLGAPAPDTPYLQAGIGGGTLYPHALEAVLHLRHAIDAQRAPLDVVACGGVLDSASYAQYRALGVRAVQYWSALIYRGWLAAPLIYFDA
jgi:dihydroorotate dehydrogenase